MKNRRRERKVSILPKEEKKSLETRRVKERGNERKRWREKEREESERDTCPQREREREREI